MSSDRIKSIREMKLDNMSFVYENETRAIFENITFTMPKSRAVWVRSPGGRGKSTLLRILAGLLAPTSGDYLINGERVSDMSFEDFLAYRLGIGYGFDLGGLLNNKTLSENLLFPLEYHKMVSIEEAQERVARTLEVFALTQSATQRPFAVSGSMRKLTCVLRSLITWPEVVFLDDPHTGLKQDILSDLIYFVEESYATRGLRQMFFTSENPLLAEHFKAEELLISVDWFTSRLVA